MGTMNNSQFMNSSSICNAKSDDSVCNVPLCRTEKVISNHFNKLFKELYMWQQKAPVEDESENNQQ